MEKEYLRKGMQTIAKEGLVQSLNGPEGGLCLAQEDVPDLEFHSFANQTGYLIMKALIWIQMRSILQDNVVLGVQI